MYEHVRWHLRLFCIPMESACVYMKDNNDMLHGGKLLPEFKKIWADYYVKFIKAYEKEGIPVWGLTVQNEPMANKHGNLTFTQLKMR